jgi:hypothetical protein
MIFAIFSTGINHRTTFNIMGEDIDGSNLPMLPSLPNKNKTKIIIIIIIMESRDSFREKGSEKMLWTILG